MRRRTELYSSRTFARAHRVGKNPLVVYAFSIVADVPFGSAVLDVVARSAAGLVSREVDTSVVAAFLKTLYSIYIRKTTSEDARNRVL